MSVLIAGLAWGLVAGFLLSQRVRVGVVDAVSRYSGRTQLPGSARRLLIVVAFGRTFTLWLGR